MAWLLPSEVQPLETRSVGQSFATAVNFLVSATIFTECTCSSAELAQECIRMLPALPAGPEKALQLCSKRQADSCSHGLLPHKYH